MFANFRSGSARRFPQAVVLLEDAGIHVTSVRFTLTRDAIKKAIDESRFEDVDLVLACGGDGTVGSVVDAVVGQDITVGIVAAGTSNNFARSLGIAPSLRGSVEAIREGRQLSIDVGEVNGLYFAHAAIMGLNVDFAREAQRLRTVIGRLSYPVSSLLVYRNRRRLSIRVQSDRGEQDLNTFQLAVINAPDFAGALDGSIPDVDVKGHTLRLLSVEDLPLRTIVSGLPRIFFQRHLGLPGAKGFNVESATVITPEPVPLTLDGEIRTTTPATIRVLPNALRVIVGKRLHRQP